MTDSVLVDTHVAGYILKDPYDYATGPDQGHALNSVDMANMIATGYEPASLTLLGTGVLGAFACGHRPPRLAPLCSGPGKPESHAHTAQGPL